MDIRKEVKKEAFCIKFLAEESGVAVGRAFLYLLYNDLHEEPFALMEDVFVDSEFRGKGIGGQLIDAALAEAKKQGCYKVICTSRNAKEDLHKWYEKKGFVKHGFEFRIDFK